MRYFHLSAILISLTTSALAEEPLQCNFPEPGRWMLNMGQTRTNMGPGGGPESQPFDLVVEGCGESLLTYGFGGSQGGYEKRLNRTADDTYVFETTYRGIPVSVSMTMENSRQMNGDWSFGNFARAPGAAEFLGPANMAEVNPLCHCEAFRQRLRDAIESDEYWRSIYSDARFSNRPEGLDPSIGWNILVQEELISLVTSESNPVSYGQAVSNFNQPSGSAPAGEGAAHNSAAQTGSHQPSNSSGATAITKARTCEVELLQPATGCAADILDASAMAHENYHSETCIPYRTEALATALSSNPTPTYAELIYRDPAFNAANEVEAYNIGIAFIRDTYLEMCKTPLN